VEQEAPDELIGRERQHANPEAYLADVLTKLVANWPNARLGELTPWVWAGA
jgi:hypothetical protein